MLIYLNRSNGGKRFKARRYYSPNGTIKNYKVIINGKSFYDQAIDSDIKRYKEIRKLTTWQGKDYELDADPKAIPQIEFVGQLKHEDDVNAGGVNAQSMFALTITEMIKETRLEVSQGSVTVL